MKKRCYICGEKKSYNLMVHDEVHNKVTDVCLECSDRIKSRFSEFVKKSVRG